MSLVRVFADNSFVVPVVLGTVSAHGIGWLARSRRWSDQRVALASFLGLVGYLIVAVEPKGGFTLPTLSTLESLAKHLREGIGALESAAAPTPVGPGVLVLAVAAAWIFAYVSDGMAFRAEASLGAAIPALIFFLVTATLGTTEHREIVTGVLLATFAAFLLAQHPTILELHATWFQTTAPGGSEKHGARVAQWSLSAGVIAAATAIAIGLVLGPSAPGASADPIVDLNKNDSNNGGPRVLISPLVSMKTQLSNGDTTELFRVKSPGPIQWRLTALDEFNGEIWGGDETYKSAKDGFKASEVGSGPSTEIEQSYEIGALATAWLPAAYQPMSVTIENGSVTRVNPVTGAILISKGDISGLSYSVRSHIPLPSAADLRTASGEIPTDIAERNLALPPTLPTEILDLARDITKNSTTNYAKALALQDFLRGPEFTYSLEVSPGHDNNALRSFLIETQTGYCEQFAGAFGAMARVVGVPTRIAVGFTAGLPGADGWYHVTTAEAHAWPEVYFPGFGWIPFEPTKSRYEPTANNATGTFQIPTTTVAPGPTTTAGPGASTVPGAFGMPTTTATPMADGTGASGSGDGPGTGTGGGSSPKSQGDSGTQKWLVVLVALPLELAALAVAFLGIVVLAKSRRRNRRRMQMDPRAKIFGAWREALDRLGESGVEGGQSRTALEFASSLADSIGGQAHLAMQRLAEIQGRACFSPQAPSDEDAVAAWESVDLVLQWLNQSASFLDRWRRRINPAALRHDQIALG